jgi:hypothetical protein
MALKERVLFLAIELFYFSLRTPGLCDTEPTVLSLTAIWMAAKFEDAWAPFVNGFFKLDSVLELRPRMSLIEADILSRLNFNVNLVLVYDFFVAYCHVSRIPPKGIALGVFLLNSLLAVQSFYCCDKKLIAMALCRIVAKTFKLAPSWHIPTIAGRSNLVLPVGGCLLNRKRPELESLETERIGRPDNDLKISFDVVDLKHLEQELVDLLKETLPVIGEPISARYDSDKFFRVTKVRLLGETQ